MVIFVSYCFYSLIMIKENKEYLNNIFHFEDEHKLIQKKIKQTIFFRVLIFLGTIGTCYLLSQFTGLTIASGILGALGFMFMVQRHAKLDRKKKYYKELIAINRVEIEASNGNFEHLETGEEYLNPEHYFSYDIDLFGKGSFFQFFNRTKTLGGRNKLAELLISNDISGIELRQQAIKDLTKNCKERQHFMATAGIVKTDVSSSVVENWLKNYNPFASSNFISILVVAFPISSAILLGMLSVDLISTYTFTIWFLTGLFITGGYLKKVNAVYNDANKISETISQYADLLEIIEKSTFSSQLLKEQQTNISTEHADASRILKQLGRALDRLNSRNNFIVGIFGNSLLLWDVLSIHLLEKWINNYSVKVEKWFDAIYFVDAMQSAANFAYNHAAYSFPKINNDENVIQAKNLGHPLIDGKKRVNNDFTIHKKNFIIITGANMAGKSTFLRTISLNIVLANFGMPTSSSEFNYSPIKLITSMRTSDSLQKEESYFFSELKRLKFIVDNIKTEKYFIILDEILKGTNSKDKEMGSKKFVEKLVASGSTGIIATHDLGLCEIHQRFPEVINHFFDAEIINDELHFDYKFKNGICKNMNASFLLRKMEIVDD